MGEHGILILLIEYIKLLSDSIGIKEAGENPAQTPLLYGLLKAQEKSATDGQQSLGRRAKGLTSKSGY